MKQVRTYEEAVKIMVDWWIEKSFKTINNKNNGDNNPMLALLMMMGDQQAADTNTSDKQKKFENSLTTLLLDVPEDKRKWTSYTELGVDYHPNQILSKAIEMSGIDGRCLPIKTFTYIKEDNTVTGRYQYGGDWFTI